MSECKPIILWCKHYESEIEVIRRFRRKERHFGTHDVIPCQSVTHLECHSPSDQQPKRSVRSQDNPHPPPPHGEIGINLYSAKYVKLGEKGFY